MATWVTWLVTMATLLPFSLARPPPELMGWRSHRLHQPPGGDFFHQPGGDYYNQPGGDYNQQGGDFFRQPGGDYNQAGGEFFRQPGGDYNQPGGDYNQPGGDYNQPGGDYNQPGGDYNQRGGEPSSRNLDIGFTVGEDREDSTPQPAEGHVRGWGEPVHWARGTGGDPEVIAQPLGSRVGEIRLRNDRGYQLMMHVPPSSLGNRPGVLKIDLKATLFRPIYY